MFRHAIPIETGEVVEREGFVFADLLPAKEARRRYSPLAAQGGDNFCDVVVLKQSDAGNSRRASRNTIARIRQRNSAERQDRHAGSESGLDFLVVSGDASARLSQTFQTNCLSASSLLLENRSVDDEVCSVGFRGKNVGMAVAGNAEEKVASR